MAQAKLISIPHLHDIVSPERMENAMHQDCKSLVMINMEEVRFTRGLVGKGGLRVNTGATQAAHMNSRVNSIKCTKTKKWSWRAEQPVTRC